MPDLQYDDVIALDMGDFCRYRSRFAESQSSKHDLLWARLSVMSIEVGKAQSIPYKEGKIALLLQRSCERLYM